MDRRTFVSMTAGGWLATFAAARAQDARRVLRIGVLTVGAVETTAMPPPFLDAMREYGWIEGQNLRFERRIAANAGELPAQAAELAVLKVDMVIAFGTPAAMAMKQASGTVPVIFSVGFDPVGSGLVTSLARPGGNLTGFHGGLFEGKMLELLKEALPRASLFVHPDAAPDPGIARVASTLGIRLRAIAVANASQLDGFFRELRGAKADGVVIPPLTWLRPPSLARIAEEFLTTRMPAVCAFNGFAEAGGLMSFGPRARPARMALYANRIANGANPGDMPVDLPTQFDLTVNLRTAAAFGLAIPKVVLLRANEVIR